jgi:pilus assembly protein CpaB
MKSKAMPHIILAVILALTAGFLTIRWLGSVQRGGEKPKETVAAKKIDVVVAARPIPKGARLDASMMRSKPFDADFAPVSAETNQADLEGRITSRDISQDDPITQDKLLPKGVTAAGLPNAVEPGKRAVTVKGTKVMGSGGLITPGSRVDVVATFAVQGKTGETKVGKLLMEDIPVLTTGTEMETHIGKDGKEELSSTDLFTLMVTPEQTEQLALASDHGSLHFALRHTGDEKAEPTPGTNFTIMSGQAGEKSEGTGAATSSPAYAYQAVRASAPRATAQSSGEGGGQGAQATPAAASSSTSSTKSETEGPGAKEESQGTGQIKVHQVTIECETCPPKN